MRQVLADIFDHTHATHIAALLLDLFQAAEPGSRGPARLGIGQTRGPVLSCFHGEVKTQLVVEFAFDATAARERAKAQQKIRPTDHAPVPLTPFPARGRWPRPCAPKL